MIEKILIDAGMNHKRDCTGRRNEEPRGHAYLIGKTLARELTAYGYEVMFSGDVPELAQHGGAGRPAVCAAISKKWGADLVFRLCVRASACRFIVIQRTAFFPIKATNDCNRAIYQFDDTKQRYLLRRKTQKITALNTFIRVHKPICNKLMQNFQSKAQCDGSFIRQGFCIYNLRMTCQRSNNAKRIIRFGSNSHSSSLYCYKSVSGAAKNSTQYKNISYFYFTSAFLYLSRIVCIFLD